MCLRHSPFGPLTAPAPSPVVPEDPLLVPARSALVLGAATCLLLTGAPAATAATTTDVVGATSATALRLTLNLPGGAATRVELTLDPVTGTVSRTASTTAAAADARVLTGSLGGQSQSLGGSSAKLPEPLESSSNPTGAIAAGLAGTPLANLLKVELLPSSASVTGAPASTSEAAVANLGAGLPDALAGALALLIGPLAAGVAQILTTLAQQSGTPVAQICAGATDAVEALDPATSEVDEILAALPIPVPVEGVITKTALGALCGLSMTLAELNTALQNALASLTGDSGVLGTGLITSRQSITSTAGRVSAEATSSVAGLTLLGQKPFAAAQVLSTTARAATAGTPGSASAAIESTVADLRGGTVDPFLQIRSTINGIRDSFVGEGALPQELSTLFDDLFGTLNAALAPVGFSVFALDDSADAKAIESCPSELDGTLTGTLQTRDGSCAAAATRGVGLSLTLPTALATPLQIGGPLVLLQVVPTAAGVGAEPRETVVRSQGAARAHRLTALRRTPAV